jgi:uncharacterized protein with PhoU and TrkA domain
MTDRRHTDGPPTLTALFGAAKDTSELMLDLGYAAVLYDDADIAKEVLALERRLADLVQGMREVCMLAARSVADAAELAAFLRLTDAITTLGDGAVDIAKIVTKRLGLPAGLRADLLDAVEVTDLLAVRTGGSLDGLTMTRLEAEHPGIRVLALRRRDEWLFDPEGRATSAGGEDLLVRGTAETLATLRRTAGSPLRTTPDGEQQTNEPLDLAIDTLIDMKNVAETAVAIAYAAVLTGDSALAGHVNTLEDNLDTMRETVETWALSASRHADTAQLRGLLHLAVAAETIGDAAQAMVWPIERGEPLHPVISDALAASEDSVAIIEITAHSPADGGRIADLDLPHRGISVLALTRNGRWDYRPTPTRQLQAGDCIVATGATIALQDMHVEVAGSTDRNNP